MPGLVIMIGAIDAILVTKRVGDDLHARPKSGRNGTNQIKTAYDRLIEHDAVRSHRSILHSLVGSVDLRDNGDLDVKIQAGRANDIHD